MNVEHSAIDSKVAALLPHSPSSLECEKGKTYNEKMQFVHMIILYIYI
jgi:hypothetical protein